MPVENDLELIGVYRASARRDQARNSQVVNHFGGVPLVEDRRPRLLGNAVGFVICTIGGLMAGLAFGVIRSWIGPHDPFIQLGFVVSGGVVGSALGVGLAVVLAVVERGSFRSLKKTMAFVAVAAVVLWAIITLVRELIR